MHTATIAAKLITDPTGTPTGLAVSIEIAASDTDAEGLRAAFAEGFRLLQQAITDQLGSPAIQQEPAEQPPAVPPSTPPATPQEAEQRFFARYGAVIGGQDWLAVRRYLNSRAPKPTSVDGWIAAAEMVRDASRQDAAPASNSRAPSRR